MSSVSNFDRFPQELLRHLLKISTIGHKTFEYRLVCKHWEATINEIIFTWMSQLKKNIDHIPDALKLHSIVTSISLDVKSISSVFAVFNQQVKRELGLVTQQVRFITSCRELRLLSERQTNLHALWGAIKEEAKKKSVILPNDLQTAEEISRWMRKHPEEIGSITELDLDNKGLTAIPPEIGCLIKVTHCLMGRNFLKTLPPEIGNLTLMEELYLNDNQLENLPSELANLTKLTHLGLSNNKLKGLPLEMEKLNVLENLNLENNQIETLDPKSLPENLCILNLIKNKIKDISMLAKLNSLQMLYLNHNLIQDSSALNHLHQLKHLQLIDNLLDKCPLININEVHLKSLYLDGNRIEELPMDFFETQTELEILQLSYNKIKRLPLGIEKLELKRFKLDGNPFEELSQEVLTSSNSTFKGIQRFKRESEFPAQSPLSHFYLAILNRTNYRGITEEIKKAFCQLPEKDLNSILDGIEPKIQDLTDDVEQFLRRIQQIARNRVYELNDLEKVQLTGSVLDTNSLIVMSYTNVPRLLDSFEKLNTKLG